MPAAWPWHSSMWRWEAMGLYIIFMETLLDSEFISLTAQPPHSQERGTQPLVGPASLSQSVFRVLSLAWGTQMGWGACKHRQNRGAPICSIVGYPGAAKNPVVWASPPSTTSELIIRWGAPCGLESALRHKAMLSLGPPGRRRERAPRFCLDKAELRGPCCCNQGFQLGPSREAMK